MPKATPFSAIAEMLSKLDEAKKYRWAQGQQLGTQAEERKRAEQNRALAERLQLIREIGATKPSTSSWGTTAWVDPTTYGPGFMPTTDITKGMWQVTPRTQPKKLTAREKAELKFEFDKKRYDYELEHPKTTGKSRDEIISAYQKALTTLSNMQNAARKYEADERPIPSYLKQGIINQLDLVLANQDDYYRATGLTDPRMGTGISPESYAGHDPTNTPEWFAYLGNVQKTIVEKRGKPFDQAEINQLKQEYMDALGE